MFVPDSFYGVEKVSEYGPVLSKNVESPISNNRDVWYLPVETEVNGKKIFKKNMASIFSNDDDFAMKRISVFFLI